MTPELYAAALLILLVAYFIRGITGFGSGLIAVPLLAHFLPLTFVVPLSLMLDFSASLVLSRHAPRHVNWSEIMPLLPSTLAGIGLGALVLTNAPRGPLLLVLGILVIFFALRTLLNVQGDSRISRWWAAPAGLAGGTISALFGTGGPPYVIYLSHRLRDKSRLRATFSGLFLIEGTLRIIAFLATGLLLQEQLLTAVVLAAPVMVLGLFLGHRVHLGISNRQLMLLLGLLLLVSGGSLVGRAWSQ